MRLRLVTILALSGAAKNVSANVAVAARKRLRLDLYYARVVNFLVDSINKLHSNGHDLDADQGYQQVAESTVLSAYESRPPAAVWRQFWKAVEILSCVIRRMQITAVVFSLALHEAISIMSALRPTCKGAGQEVVLKPLQAGKHPITVGRLPLGIVMPGGKSPAMSDVVEALFIMTQKSDFAQSQLVQQVTFVHQKTPNSLGLFMVLSSLLDREAPNAPHSSQAAAPPVSQALVQAAGLSSAQPKPHLPCLQGAGPHGATSERQGLGLAGSSPNGPGPSASFGPLEPSKL
ncbi:MAG: hypothetical protein FRX49_01792 [Trebouxia sp. A1-2]|nr:MAG: hypothetical protein FRX49_01792 [Trebouxia sp. A1-2]